ncbi:MAG: glycosyltransferase family 2 protein [Saprospiraceae bacterium]
MNEKVTVLVTSYNCADTIRKCLQSILDQKTTFGFKIVVLDDGSTDRTYKVLEGISDYKLHIKYNPHKGLQESITRGLWECDTEYVCTVGADDYWLNARKLQMQVDYMEANPEMGMCFTEAFARSEKGYYPVINNKPSLTYDQLLRRTAFVNITNMFRIDILKQLNPDVFKKLWIYDYPLFLIYSIFSKIGYIPYVTGVFLLTSPESTTRTRSRSKRFKLLYGKYKMVWWFIMMYKPKPFTYLFLVYKLTRDIYSTIFKRW